jgi:NDP-sugar pyrophosphorylase family protein
LLTVAVLAGGLGTRLRAITGDLVPKVMAPVLGRPFIDYKLESLAADGAERVLLLIGHQADQIRTSVGSGDRFGLHVSYVDDGPTLRGTGGALRHALDELGDAFWVTYGDTLLDVTVPEAEETFAASGLSSLMTVLHNRDRYEPSNVRVEHGRVVEYRKQPSPSRAEHIDYGMLAFRREAFEAWDDGAGFDLGAVLEACIARDSMLAFEVTERFHDIGTVEALQETEAFLRDRAK